MMPTSIVPIAAPPSRGATTKLDHSILNVLSDGMYYQPHQIRDRLAIDNPGITLRDIYPRLRVLAERQVIERIIPDGAPKRGLGAGLYRKT